MAQSSGGPSIDTSLLLGHSSQNDREDPDKELSQLFAELAVEQEEFKQHQSAEFPGVAIGLVGEARAMGRSNSAVAAVKARVKSGSPLEAWCREERLPLGMRFELSVYGESVASKLARAWAHRLHFLFLICSDHADA
eukprot:2975947-Amphidinium_carterae.1